MSEWWTYRPQNFLMFAPDTYWRLFELANQAAWPLPIVLPMLGVAWIAWWWRRPAGAALPVATAALALALAAVARFHLQTLYAPINWAALQFAWLFWGLAAALVMLLAVTVRSRPRSAETVVRRGIALGLFFVSVGMYPLLAIAGDRPWLQAEVIGLAPDPTVIALLGLLLASRAGSGWMRRLLHLGLWCGALLWCAIASATLWTMGSAQGAVPAVAGALALLAAVAARVPGRHEAAGMRAPQR